MAANAPSNRRLLQQVNPVPLTITDVLSVLIDLVPATQHDGMSLTGDGNGVDATILEALDGQGGGFEAEELVDLMMTRLLPSLGTRLGVDAYFTRLPSITYVRVNAPPPPSLPPSPPPTFPPFANPPPEISLSNVGENLTTDNSPMDQYGIYIIAASVGLLLIVVSVLLFTRKMGLWGNKDAGDIKVQARQATVQQHMDLESANADANNIQLDVGEQSPSSRSMRDEALVPAARAQANLMLAMGALQMLMLARTPEELEAAINHAQMVSGLPKEALAVARQQLALLKSGKGGTAGVPDKALEAQMQAMANDLQHKMALLGTLQAKLAAMQVTQAELELENERLRAASLTSSGGPRMARGSAGDDEEDEQDREDRLAREGNAAAKKVILAALADGLQPTAAMYTERDVHMYNLSDADIRGEYVYYSSLYLGDQTAANVRGMAEMTLIKLGEIIDMPQAKRAKLIERQATEARKAREARQREEGNSIKERAERQRQFEMNEQAYYECRARWEQLTQAMMAGGYGLHDEARALAKRVAHRSELRLVTMPPDGVKRMPPGTFVAMGTSGLQPTEMRAVLHALVAAGPTGAAAQNFTSMLTEKVMKLDDYVPSPIDIFESGTADAPLGMASGRGTMAKAPPRTPSQTIGAQSSWLAAQEEAAAALSRSPSDAVLPPYTCLAKSPSAAPPPPLPPPPPPVAPPRMPPPMPRKASQSASSDPRSSMMDELVRKASARQLRASQAAAQDENNVVTKEL